MVLRDRAWPSLLMLVLVTSGLFMMHTLGHFTVHDPMPRAHMAMTMDRHDADPSATKDSPASPAVPMGGVTVCVAILCALIVLAVTALLLVRLRGWQRGWPTMTSVIMDAVRGPPKMRIGLTIADLAVLRN